MDVQPCYGTGYGGPVVFTLGGDCTSVTSPKANQVKIKAGLEVVVHTILSESSVLSNSIISRKIFELYH